MPFEANQLVCEKQEDFFFLKYDMSVNKLYVSFLLVGE